MLKDEYEMVYLDECMFTVGSIPKVAWSNKLNNIAIDKKWMDG